MTVPLSKTSTESVYVYDLRLLVTYNNKTYTIDFQRRVVVDVPYNYSPCAGLPNGDYWIDVSQISSITAEGINSDLPTNNYCLKYVGDRYYFAYALSNNNGYVNYSFESLNPYPTNPFPTVTYRDYT
ncbi:MAG: hypothetical protein QXM83_04145 [Ignisphaera sp.]